MRRIALLLALLPILVPCLVSAQLAMNAKPIVEIGAADGSVDEAFSMIGDVAVTGRGDILVLDRFATDIAWFAASGRFIRRIGRSGSGPGEFRQRYAMAVDGQNRLHVYDPGGRRISVYALSDTLAVHLADQRIESVVNDICIIGDRRFVLTPEQPAIIHELDRDGQAVRSFGAPEQPHRDVARRIPNNPPRLLTFYNQALLACDAASGTIAVVHENVPVVRLFGIDGTLRWRAVLADFHQREVNPSTRFPMGFEIRTDPDIGSAHAGSAVAFTPDRRLVVTLWEGGPSNIEGRIETRILDVGDGRELERQDAPPARLTKVVGGRSYAYTQYPYPRVLVY